MANNLGLLASVLLASGIGGGIHGVIAAKDKRWGYCAVNAVGGPLVSTGSIYYIIKRDPSIKNLGGIAGSTYLAAHARVSVPLAYSLGFCLGASFPVAGYMLKGMLTWLN